MKFQSRHTEFHVPRPIRIDGIGQSRGFQLFLRHSFSNIPRSILSNLKNSRNHRISNKLSDILTDERISMSKSTPQIVQLPISDFDKVFTSSYVGMYSIFGVTLIV